MTADLDPTPGPPRWVGTVFRCILPCDGMREAILGDLHEEFSREAARLGPDHARIRYRNRALGILAHAAWDSVRWRTWASNHAARQPTPGSREDGATARPSRRRPIARRTAVVGGGVGVGIAVFAILGVGVVVNTSVFAAVDRAAAPGTTPSDVREALTLAPERAPAESRASRAAPVAAAVGSEGSAGEGLPAPLALVALGAIGLVVMIVCAALAALILCRAPGWGSDRAARGLRPVSPPAG